VTKGWHGESGRHSLAAKGVRSPRKRITRPQRVCSGKGRKRLTKAQAKAIGDAIGVDWSVIEVEQFREGMLVELEHGCNDPSTNVTYDDLNTTGKIAHAHLKESPDYYRWLHCMEKRMDEGGPPPKSQFGELLAAGALVDALKDAEVKIYDPTTGMQFEYRRKKDTEE